MLNKWIGIGNLGSEPSLRYTPSGKAVCNFNIAVDGGRKDTTEWVSIVVWEKQAEACSQYLKKGSMVAVTGRLATRTYDDKEGIKRKVTEVIAEQVKFLSKREQGSSSSATQSNDSDEMFEDQDVPF